MKDNNREPIDRLARRLRRRHYLQAQGETSLAGACGANDDAPVSHVHEHHHPRTAELEKSIENLREQLLRSQAEFDNYRKRQRREEQQRAEQANQRLIEQLLPVVDNFKRALASPGDSVDGLRSGLDMVNKQLQDILAQNGLETINPLGQTFDPNQHEAVAIENDPGQADNQVAEVFQEGYTHKGRLLRPAMVKVTRS